MAIPSLSNINRLGVSAFNQSGSTVNQVVVNFPTVRYRFAEYTVSSPGLVKGSAVFAWLNPTDEYDAQSLSEIEVIATSNEDNVLLTFAFTGPLIGDLSVNYIKF